MKRWIDLALALPAALAALPLVAALALVVALSSPGIPFHTAVRVGRGGRHIRVLKLRTMHAGAEFAGPPLTAADDPRVTAVGRRLRALRLDELPQLWNVLRGEMSLVGPRPESPLYVDDTPEWRRLLSVRPGIAGTAALAFADEEALLARAPDRERAYREVVLPAKLRLSLADVDPGPPGGRLRL
ncbi:MAG TPA: sugar transferase, partial [Longimicrobium sp.]|nr:sugar transferase [Longimicrobium sp.]